MEEGAQDIVEPHSLASAALSGNNWLVQFQGPAAALWQEDWFLMSSPAAAGSTCHPRVVLLHKLSSKIYMCLSTSGTQRGSSKAQWAWGSIWVYVFESMFLFHFIFYFWIFETRSLCSLGWPQIHMILLPQPPKFLDYSSVLPCPTTCFYFNLIFFHIFCPH